MSTCGYDHFCTRGVQFISRYRDENDYCVGGERVRVFDNGAEPPRANGKCVSTRQVQAILLFELDKYAVYLAWHVENDLGSGLLPFDFAHLAEHLRTGGANV